MDNLMFVVGFIGQWAKANPKIPSILVVLAVAGLGYVGFWLSPEFPAAYATWVKGAVEAGRAPLTMDLVRGFLAAGGIWAMKGITALQLTSAVASGASHLNLPQGVQNALPVTQN